MYLVYAFNKWGSLPSGSPLCNEKSLGRDRSYTGEVVLLCLGLVEACHELMSQRYIEPVYCYISVPHIMDIHSEQTVAHLY